MRDCAASSGLRLLSFDLDDTLWPMRPVLDAANYQLVNKMVKVGAKSASTQNLQHMLKSIRQKDASLSYSAARVKAIRQILNANKLSHINHTQLYDVWLRARHNAADDLLYPGTLETLTQLREAFPETIFAAITNGPGDPLAMRPEFAACFDLTITGEDSKVFPGRKPSPIIYNTALSRAGVEASEGWVHCGDDILNDVATSKALGATTIWLTDSSCDPVAEINPYSTLNVREKAAREAQRRSVSLSCVDCRIRHITELPAALIELLGSRS